MIPFAASAERYSEWLRGMITSTGALPFPDPGGKERARVLIEGEQMLSVPVKGGASVLKRRERREENDIEISAHGRWQEVHLGALRAAYGKTPYFIHFFPKIEEIYRYRSEGKLLDFNEALHSIICRGIGITPEIVETLQSMDEGEKSRLKQIGEEKRRNINMNHSILEVLFRLGKEGLFLLMN